MVWLSCVARATEATSWADLDRRFDRYPDRWDADLLQVFSRIAKGKRSPPQDLVDLVDQDSLTVGTKKIFEGALWSILIDPPANFESAHELCTTQLSRFRLRRASVTEALWLAQTFGLSGSALAIKILVALLHRIDPVDALGIYAALYREADLAACAEMTEALIRVIDIRADTFLRSHLKVEDWELYYPLLVNGLRYAARPTQSAENWFELTAESLLLPIVSEDVSFNYNVATGRAEFWPSANWFESI